MKDEILSNFGPFETYREEQMRVLRKPIKTWKWLQEIPNSKQKLQIKLYSGSGCSIKFSKV